MAVLGRLKTLEWEPQLCIPDDVLDWLRELGDPTLMHVAGQRPGAVRVATTLLHGNEPSGIRAMHAWLRRGQQPAHDALLFVASPSVALHGRPFSRRVIPELGDLNRRWLAPGDDEPGQLVRDLISALRGAEPHYLIDLHNNTGHNPPYGVGCEDGAVELGLVSLFGTRHIHSQLVLGSLVEATRRFCPSVTIECGLAGSAEADAVALGGLARFLEEPDLERSFEPERVEVLDDPVRVSLRNGVTLGFADLPRQDVDLTVVSDVDRHNFGRLAPGAHVGWLRDGAPWPIEAVGMDGRDRSHDWFVLRDGWLEARVPLMPVMMTTVVENAALDCLFYVVRTREQRPAHPVE